MQKIEKRFLAVFLTLVMLLGMFPALALPALAEEAGEAPVGYVTMSADANTLGAGFLYEPMKVPFYEDDTYFDVTARFLGAGNYKGSSSILAIKLQDEITVDVHKIILDALYEDWEIEEGDVLEEGRADQDYLSGGDYDYFYGLYSGWMYSVNDAFSDKGADADYPVDGDVCRWQFTLYGLGADLGEDVDWGEGYQFDAFYTRANKDALTAAVAAVNTDADKDILLEDSGVLAAYNAAYSALADLTASQEDIDGALNALEEALGKLDGGGDDGEDDPAEPEHLALIVETGEYYDDFAEALALVEDGQTIKLFDDVSHAERIVIDGKSITFDVNGFILDVKADVTTALSVIDVTNGEIGLLDSSASEDGEFNVTAASGNGHAVWVRDADSRVTVTSARVSGTSSSYAANAAGGTIVIMGSAVGGDCGVYASAGGSVTVGGDVSGLSSFSYLAYANGAGSTIHVKGSAMGGYYGAYAVGGGSITVDGNTSGTFAAYATGAGSAICVKGNAAGESYGAYGAGGGSVTVDGDASGTAYPVCASGENSSVEVKGNVSGASYGAYAGSGGKVKIGGNANATTGVGAYATSTAAGATSAIEIGGDVTGVTYGASAGINSRITIEGEIEVPESGVYIRVNTTDKTKAAGAALVTKPNYLTYASGTAVVYVKDTSGAEPADPRVAVLTLGGSYKTSYIKGDDFTVEGMTISAEKNDGTSCTIDLEDEELSFSGYNLDTAGRYTVAVRYEDGLATYDIIVNSTEPKVAIGTEKYDTLADALAAVKDGETIKLLEDINYDDKIVVTGTMDEPREITFDVNGFVLEVRSAASSTTPAVDVTNGAVHLDDSKGGEFNVFTTTGGHAVWARIGGSVTVTNATALGSNSGGYGAYATDGGSVEVKGNSTGSRYGAYANGASADGETASTITVGGNVVQTIDTMNLSHGAYAQNGGKITVGGNVSTSGCNAAYTSGANSSVIVRGNVTSRGGTSSVSKYGVYAGGADSLVHVEGDVYAPSYGVYADNGATATVDGDVTTDGTGVSGSGTVTVKGDVFASSTGISSYGSCNITIEGNVSSGGTGVSGSGTATVKGNISASNTGVSASANSNITVEGNVSASSTGISANGINALANIAGDVVTTNASGIGASASNGGRVVLDGELKSEGVYIRVNPGTAAGDAVDKAKADGVPYTTMPGYLGYVAAPSAVWVKGTSSETPITPIVTSISLGGDYKVRYVAGEELDVSGMTVNAVKSDGSRITIPITGDEKLQFDGYDAGMPAGMYTVTVSYEDGEATFKITVVTSDMKVEIIDADGAAKKQYADFAAAVADVESGETIRLLKDVHHVGPVEIRGTSELRKTVIFDVGEYTLTIECVETTDNALLVYYATVALISDGGELNIVGSGSNSYGIGAYNESEVMVSNVTGGYYAVTANSESIVMVEKNIYSNPDINNNNASYFYGVYASNASVAVGGDIILKNLRSQYNTYGAYATGASGNIMVEGNVIIESDVGTLYGAYSSSGATLAVEGDIMFEGGVSTVYGACSSGANANLTVNGDIKINAEVSSASTGTLYGLYSSSAGSLTVKGDVDVDATVSAATANVAGAYATAANSSITVNGNLTVAADVTATTKNVYGAYALTNAIIEIKGFLTAPDDDAYVRANNAIMKKEDGVPYTSNLGNLAYIDDITVVWVKDWGSSKEPITSTVRSIALSGSQKTLYFIGDEFSAEGLIITATYGDGIKIDVPPTDEDVEYSGFDSAEAGSPVVTVTYQGASAAYTVTVMGMESWDGAGTESDPYLINDVDDLMLLHLIVSNLDSDTAGQKAGYSFRGTYFLMTADITLPDDWTAIGGISHGNPSSSADNSRNMLPFSGTLDGGGHTLTFPENSDSLFAKTREAYVKNLKIYGPSFETCAILNSYFVDYGPNNSYSYAPGFFPQFLIDIDNVTLLKGSKTAGPGFTPSGFASGINHIYIRNSLVEKGVECVTASFSGSLNGIIENCVSYATVRGESYVGGMVGRKDQSMGPCQIINCAFYGDIIATGSYVGGMVGGGYASDSAPGTPCVSIWNCLVAGTVTGANNVGGIYGGEPVAMGGYTNSNGYIMNNIFVGEVKLTAGANIGAIIGYMRSLSSINVIENNYYAENCGASRGIGAAPAVAATYADPDNYLNAGTQSATAAALKDGTVKDLLNTGRSFMLAATNTSGINPFVTRVGGLKNWMQGDKYPVHNPDVDTSIDLSADASLYSLGLYEPATVKLTEGDDGIYRAEVENYITTIKLQVTALSPTATVTLNGDAIPNSQPTEYLSVAAGANTFDVAITSEDGTDTSEYTLIITRKAAPVVTPETVTVSFSLVGSTLSTQDVDLTGNNLSGYHGAAYEVWIQTKSFTMPKGAKVYDVFIRALREAELEYRIGNWDNYVEAIWSPSGYELAEFTNGPRSGWMYHINGPDNHPVLGLGEQEVFNGDSIVWHYVNDYSYEVEDWFDEEDYPSLGDGTLWSLWMEALESGGGSGDGGGGSTPPPTNITDPNTPLSWGPWADQFTDVNDGDWFYDAVKYAFENGLMNGTGATVFEPNTAMTRAMLLTVLYRYEGEPAVTAANKFSDVASDQWYTNAIIWASENGIAEGYGDGLFGTDDVITREQVATVLMRYAKWKTLDVSKAGELSAYSDAAEISDYALDAMKWANAEGLMTGRTTSELAPRGTTTRAEIATILMRFIEDFVK